MFIESIAQSTQQDTTSHSIHLAWLAKLRWSMIAGQVLLFTGAQWALGLKMPVVTVFVIIGIGLCSNIGLVLFLRRVPEIKEWMLGAVMVFDMLILTGLLFVTGGPANPFSFLYLVYVALGIVVLGSRWMWGISIAALFCYGSLFVRTGLHSHHTIHNPQHMRLHLEGMWVAYAITTVFIVYFVTRMKRSLMQQEAELAALHDLQMRSEKIAALAALAGGAVHEFSTPLSTIAVIARELELRYIDSPEQEESLADVRLIREEVDRCKRISHELMTQAGETLGEASLSVAIEALFESVLKGFDDPETIEVTMDQDIRNSKVPLPPIAFVQMLRGMVHNAKEASSDDAHVQLVARIDQDDLLIEVLDQGRGIAPEHLPRLGEPFYTTKAASEGHGLGLFLAKTLMERLGGKLLIKSKLNHGTSASLSFPMHLVNHTTESAQTHLEESVGEA